MVFYLSTAFVLEKAELNQNPGFEEGFVIPEDINKIFDKSCFGCHNSESSNEKGKKKLMIDKMEELSKAKLVGKLGEIAEVVEENDMPPKKFLAKYPDKALVEEESKRLVSWANEEADALMK
jgi:hypothetical protein